MLPAQQKDLFGNITNQVENYDKFRPTYPPEFYEIILKHSQQRHNYLDVACGTGQLLFDLSPHFSRSVGIDISPKQILVAQQKIIEKKLSDKISAHVCDAHSLETLAKENNLPTSYDLVTIGQALHWFDVKKFLLEVETKILNQDRKGTFAVTSYFCRGNDFALSEDEKGEVESNDEIFDAFYGTIQSYFECDQNSIKSAYEDIDFKTHFKEVDSKQILTGVPCTLFEMIKYIKTFSAYNTYINLKKNEPNFVDPAEVFEKATQEKINSIQKKTGKTFTNPLRMKNFYFLRVFKML